jgi:hypothetical protein
MRVDSTFNLWKQTVEWLTARDPKAAPPLADLPLYEADNGRLEILLPLGPLPNRWTRFKAAMSCIPLIRRLETIRRAGHEVKLAVEASNRYATHMQQAQCFRSQVEQKLCDDYGSQVASSGTYPLTGDPDSPVLTAKQFQSVVQTAKTKAQRLFQDTAAPQNDRELQPPYEPPPRELMAYHVYAGQKPKRDFFRAYARAWAIAKFPDYFSRNLGVNEIAAVKDAVAAAIGYIERAASNRNALYDELTALCKNCEKEMESLPQSQRSTVAERLVQKVIIRLTARTPDKEPDVDDMKLVALLCASTSSQPAASTMESAAKAWEDLATVHDGLTQQIASVTGVENPDEASRLLRQLARDAQQTALSREELSSLARRQFIKSRIQRLCDVQDANSLLNWTVADTHPDNGDPDRQAQNLAWARFLAQSVPDEKMLAMIENTRDPMPIGQVLGETIKEATRQHFDALRQIKDSKTLDGPQQDLLLRYASGQSPSERVLYPIRVSTYENIAIAIRDQHLPAIELAVMENQPALLFDALQALEREFRRTLQAALGDAPLSESLHTPAYQEDTFDLCVQLALAPSNSQSEASTWSSDDDHIGPGSETQEAADFGSQFIHFCKSSPLPEVQKLGARYDQIRRIAQPACGRHPEIMPNALNMQPTNRPPPNMPPVYRASPELLLRLFDVPTDGPVRRDARGVVAGYPGGKLVAWNIDPTDLDFPDFSSVGLFKPAPERAEVEGQEAPSSSQKLGLTLGTADIIICPSHGAAKRLTLDPPKASGDESSTENLPSAKLDTPAPTRQEITAETRQRGQRVVDALEDAIVNTVPNAAALLDAIGGCLCSDLLDKYTRHVNERAFNPVVTMANPSRNVHEVIQDEDGWMVRSTHVGHPVRQGNTPLNPDGVILYSLTHRIEPDEHGGMQPRLVGCQTIFAF